MIRRSILVSFVMLFAGIAAVTAQTKHAHKTQSQTIRVNVTDAGYQPDSFQVRRGILTKLIFTRRTESDCGAVLVIPKYGVHRDLPLNTPVVVTFRPRDTGTFNFTCGMNMFRGQIIVD